MIICVFAHSVCIFCREDHWRIYGPGTYNPVVAWISSLRHKRSTKETNLRRTIVPTQSFPDAMPSPSTLSLKAFAEFESQVKAEVEARLKPEVEARVKVEVEARIKPEVDARVKTEVEDQAKLEVQARIKAEVEAMRHALTKAQPPRHVSKVIPLTTFKQNDGGDTKVYALAVDSVTNTLISAGHDKQLVAMDMATGATKLIMTGHKGAVNCVVFTPGGQSAISGADDKTIRVWSLVGDVGGTCTDTLKGHQDWVWSLALNRSGTLLASGSSDNNIILWDCRTTTAATTGSDVTQLTRRGKPLKGHTGTVFSVVMVDDGEQLLSGSDDKTIKLWRLQPEPQLLHTIMTGHTDVVRSLALSPDETIVVSASYDDTLRVWDMVTRSCMAVLKGHTREVWAVCVTSDGGTVVSGSNDGTLRCWDLNAIISGALLPSTSSTESALNKIQEVQPSLVVQAEQGEVLSLLLLSGGDDGDRLLSAGNGNNIKMWHVD